MSVLTIVPAGPEQKPTIANLIQLCLYDMTATMPFPVGPDARFEYGFLERFWQHPYLLYAGDDIAGFALVIDHCPLTAAAPCWFMAEFFVLRAYRRSGIGSQAVAGIVDRHPGRWHVGVPLANLPALAFRDRALAPRSPLVSDIAFEDDDWRLRTFLI